MLEKRWYEIRSTIRVEEKQREQIFWVEGGYQVMGQTKEVKSDSFLLPAVNRN